MLNFDEYVTKMEERKAEEKLALYDAELFRRLTETTYEDAVQALYASLVFPVGVKNAYGEERNSDFEVVIPVEEERVLEMAI